MATKIFMKYVIAAVLLASGARAGAWTNPLALPGLEERSLGDPYIMKHLGYYYLYVSAGDEKIYCWKSKDLSEWSEPYVCCTDPVTSVAYAPEVIYWNGLFYMCTSPRGGGHYMLTSTSPTGPFIHRSGNLGRDIDGSMFVDDDGKWYFYHANNEGIRGCFMPTHLSLGEDVDLQCCMSGQWSEGPCVFKRNGLYYLIYTGNHVWTDGYRIDYAVSGRGPLEGFLPQKAQNPVLIDAETPAHKALGHGTAFVGPDLDSYYFCYHNLQDNKARRLLNFERIVWNGDKLIIAGPTDWEQEPPLTVAADYFERTSDSATGPGDTWSTPRGGEWSVRYGQLSRSDTDGMRPALFHSGPYDDFTAEFSLRCASSGRGKAGAVFCYSDEANHAEAFVNATDRTLEVTCLENGCITASNKAMLPADFDPQAWHTVRVEKEGCGIRIYIDGMLKAELDTALPAGLCGYASDGCAADFSYIAVSPYVGGSGMNATSVPLPGVLPATLFTEYQGQVELVSLPMQPAGHTFAVALSRGAVASYHVNVKDTNPYNFGLSFESDGAVVCLLEDGIPVAEDIRLRSSSGSPATRTIRDLHLSGGNHLLALRVDEGSLKLHDCIVRPSALRPRVMTDDFEEGDLARWGYVEGGWNVSGGRVESTGGYGKILMGRHDDIHMTDYTVECDVFYEEGQTNGGIIFRVTNPSTGGADDNPVLGTDFLQGYMFMAGPDGVILGKHNFGWVTLASTGKDIDLRTPHHMKVEAEGDTFRCYLDDMETPLVTFTDPAPFITGRAGLRAHGSTIRFDNFSVTPK